MLVEAYDLTAHTNLLRAGVNVLAIHGLNRDTTSSDFLIAATLVAVPAPVLPWTYARWTARFGLEGSPAEPHADDDGDDWDNALEYVLGGDPTQPDALSLAPVLRQIDSQIEYTHRRRVDHVALGIAYQVEACGDLAAQSWEPVTGELAAAPAPQPDGLTEQVTYRFTFPDPSTLLRLRITLPTIP